jgi:hypothetical protein
MLFNLFTVVQWVSDKMMHSDAYTSGVMAKAKKFDKGNLGIPVAQTLVKAFLLRSGEDMTSAQLAVASSEKENLEREKADVAARLMILDAQIDQCRTDRDQLNAKVDANAGQGDLEANISQLETWGEKNMEEWKVQGAQAIEVALSKSTAPEDASTAELEKLIEKVQAIASQIQESDTVQSAMAQGSEVAAKASQAASDGIAQASAAAEAAVKSEAFQQGLQQAQQKATEGLQQAAQVADSAIKSETVQKAMDQATHAASKAKAAATEATGHAHKKHGKKHGK